MSVINHNRQLKVTPLSSIAAAEVSSLLPPYIPKGKQTLLVGDPGDGKTWIALDMSARVTRGLGLPTAISVEGVGCPVDQTKPRNVLYFSGEDGAADTLKPRFSKLGGDHTRFYVTDGLIEDGPDGQRGHRLRLTNLLPLEEAVQELTARPRCY
jgi:DNA repair protein RadA/Sms